MVEEKIKPWVVGLGLKGAKDIKTSRPKAVPTGGKQRGWRVPKS